MTFFVTAVSPDGQRFKILENGTWELDGQAVSDKAVFRSSSWGASIEDVKSVEAAELIVDGDDLLGYKTRIAGLSAMAVYHFVDRRLVMGRYSIDEPHADKNAYFLDFNALKQLLKKKYGPPTSSDVLWKNELYKNDHSQLGLAVSCGHLCFFEVWDDGETHIELQLMGDNYEIELNILYYSVALQHLFVTKREQASLDGL